MREFLRCSAASLAIAAASSPAAAQVAPPQPPVTAPSTTSPASAPSTDTAASEAAQPTPANQLGDIVVTAQRRAENLQRAAVPVDVVSSQAILQGGLTRPDGLGRLVPALVAVPAGGARSSYFLRGVGNFTSNPLFDSAIALNYDNVYVGRPAAAAGTFYDLERVEVLKGPQGTLYGRNATGGAINVIPVQPKLGQSSGYGTLTYGNYNAVNAEGAINLSLGDRGALRIAGNYVNHDGYLSDGTSDEDTGAFRVQVLAELTPALTVRMGFDYSHVAGRGTGTNYANSYRFDPATGTYIVRPGQSAAIGLYDPVAQAYRSTLFAGPAGRTLTDLAPLEYQRNDFYGANAEIGYDTEIGTLTIIPAWRNSTQWNLTNTNGFSAGVRQEDEQYSVEARFVGERVGPLDYTLGALYFHETNVGHFAIGQQAFANFADYRQRTDSSAVFARVTGHLTDRLRLVGGVRYTSDKKRFAGVADTFTVVCAAPACPTAPLLPQVDNFTQLPLPVPPPGGVEPLIGTGALFIRAPSTIVNARLPKDRLTYRAAVEFDVADRSLLYASVETGFRSGGFSLATGYETFQPEYITAYTVGSKNRFFENRLQFNVEGFYWRYRDQQLATISLDRAGQQQNFTQNIGSSTIYGADVEARLLLTPDTVLNAQVQYLHSEYNRFAYQAPSFTGVPPYTGCASQRNAANPVFYDIDCSGKPSFNAPKWTINLGGEQTVYLGAYKVVAAVDTQYRSSRFIGFEYQPAQLAGSTLQTNAQLTIGPDDDRWSLSGFVRNIENDRYPVTANTFAIGSALVYITAPPRTYGIRGSTKF